MKRDRFIVWAAIVVQSVIAAIEMQSVLTAMVVIAITFYGLIRSRGVVHHYGSIEYQKEVSQALQTLADEPLLSAIKRTISTRVFWNQLYRLLVESQFGRRLVLALVLLATMSWRLLLGVYDAQQSSLGALCQLVVPALILAEAVLFTLLLLSHQFDTREGRVADGQLLLPLSCSVIILLIVHHQFLGQRLTLLSTSIAAGAAVAVLSQALLRGRWLGKIRFDAEKKKKRISTTVNISNAKHRRVPRPTILVFAAFAMLSWTLAVNVDSSLPAVQGWMNRRIYGPDSPLPGSRIGLAYRYVEVATLSSVRSQILDAPQAVAFRVYCDVPPGYMRGRVFEVYRGSSWGGAPLGSAAGRGERLKPVPASIRPTAEGVSLNRFRLADGGSGKTMTVEVRNDPVRGNFYFCPLGASSIEGRGESVFVDRNQIPISGLSVKHPYRSIVYQSHGTVTLNEPQLALYLSSSEQLEPILKPIAERICGDYSTTKSKAAAVQRYFRSQYQYSLDAPKPPIGQDPMVYFLRAKHPAHCEYFATAAALVLRTANVPCRYVTGYVVDELSDDSDYWIARNRNAHAWVEAYDDQEQRWFIVEATPGRNTIELKFPSDEERLEAGAGASGQKAGNRSAWKKFLDWISTSNVQYKTQFWLTRARLPLAIIVLFLLFFRFFDPLRRQYWQKGDDLWYQRVLKSIDRQAAKRGLTRSKSETLHQFASRIQQLANVAKADQKAKLISLATQYRKYALARYSGADWDAVQRLEC